MNPPFKRTTCACKECTACCKRQPGPLAPGDSERIQEHLGVTDEEMTKLFCASPGALVMDYAGHVRRVGTITPQKRKGRCVFLDENDRCKIHAVAPYGCAYFDTHMGVAEAQPRSQWLVRDQEASPEYKALRNRLPYAASYKPTGFKP